MTKKTKWIAVGVIVVAIVGICVGVAINKQVAVSQQAAVTAQITTLEADLETLKVMHDFSALKQYVPQSNEGQESAVFSITSYPNMPETYSCDVFTPERKFYVLKVDGGQVRITPDETLNNYLGKREIEIPTTTDFAIISEQAKAIEEALPDLKGFLLKQQSESLPSIISITSYPIQGSWKVKVRIGTSYSDITYSPSKKSFSMFRETNLNATDYGEGE